MKSKVIKRFKNLQRSLQIFMFKDRIKGPCGISDEGLCGKGWQLPVAGYCHSRLGVRCCVGLISSAVYLYLLKIVFVLNFWC